MTWIALLLSSSLAAPGEAPLLPTEGLLPQVQVGASDEKVSKVPS